MNTPIGFKLAKLLNSKGLPGIGYFYENKTHYDFNPKKYTIADVVMWLHEKHGIWIEARHITTFDTNRFHVIIWNYKDKSDYHTIHCSNGVGYEVWDTPRKAYLAAIAHVLKEMI